MINISRYTISFFESLFNFYLIFVVFKISGIKRKPLTYLKMNEHVTRNFLYEDIRRLAYDYLTFYFFLLFLTTLYHFYSFFILSPRSFILVVCSKRNVIFFKLQASIKLKTMPSHVSLYVNTLLLFLNASLFLCFRCYVFFYNHHS